MAIEPFAARVWRKIASWKIRMEPVESPRQQDEKLKRDRLSVRTSVFLMAAVRRPGTGDELPVRVRNLSSSGLCGDSKHPVAKGEPLFIVLPTIGEIGGKVMWQDGERFGIAFEHEIDPAKARRQSPDGNVKSPVMPVSQDYRRPGLRSTLTPRRY